MVKKIVVAMSTILILVSCLVPFSVSADYDSTWKKTDENLYESHSKDFPFQLGSYVDIDVSGNQASSFRFMGFSEIPTLYFDSEKSIYYFKGSSAECSVSNTNLFGNQKRIGYNYIYFEDFEFLKLQYSSVPLSADYFKSNSDGYIYLDDISYIKKSKVESNFVPFFDDSVPDSAKNEFLQILDDEAIDNYYSNVSIEVTPTNERWREINKFSTVASKSNPFLREKYKDDFYAQSNASPSLYFFTVKFTNRGEEPFTTVITANSKSYLPGKQSVSMSQASSDILNMFSVNNTTYITVPGNSTVEHNFNFEEIDHKSVKDQVMGILTDAPEYDIFLNFWTKTPGRVTGDNWIKLEDYPGDPSSSGYEDFRSCFSHDFSFKGYWGGASKKPDGYKDIIKDNPISDLTIDGAFGSVDFNLEPSMDDFKSMIDNSKDFLEFVRYAMANYVPAFVWIIFSTGMTGIVILRILGR